MWDRAVGRQECYGTLEVVSLLFPLCQHPAWTCPMQRSAKLLCIPLFVPWSVPCGTNSIPSVSLSRLKMCEQPLGQQCFRVVRTVPHASSSGGDSARAGSAKAGAICFLICSCHQNQWDEPGPHTNRLSIRKQEHVSSEQLSSRMCHEEQIQKQA